MRRKTQPGHFGRSVALWLLALPLLATGPCAVMAEQSLINGFFDAVTPLLIQWYGDQLGVRSATETVAASGGTTDSPTTAF